MTNTTVKTIIDGIAIIFYTMIYYIFILLGNLFKIIYKIILVYIIYKYLTIF